jgi:hypothetical protein
MNNSKELTQIYQFLPNLNSFIYRIIDSDHMIESTCFLSQSCACISEQKFQESIWCHILQQSSAMHILHTVENDELEVLKPLCK